MRGAPSDIVPHELDVEPERKSRRRKRRDLPDPPPLLKAGKAKAEARVRRMPLSPGIMLEPRKDGEPGWVRSSPHNDWDLWEIQLADTFGTRSRALLSSFIGTLKGLCRSDWDDRAQQWKTNETDLNAAIAFIADLKPRNAIEAKLAAQMFANDRVQMKLWREAYNSGGIVFEKNAALASKLARTFTMQLETLRLMRGGRKPVTRQSFKVNRETNHHQHIHVHRGAAENDGQPQGRRGAVIDQCAALPSPDEARDGLPLSSDEGEASVSSPWRQKPGRAKR
jgi:hypothetical protein